MTVCVCVDIDVGGLGLSSDTQQALPKAPASMTMHQITSQLGLGALSARGGGGPMGEAQKRSEVRFREGPPGPQRSAANRSCLGCR